MSADVYSGGFRLCPACGSAVAADRTELHDEFHERLEHELDGVADRLSELRPQAALDVREWPEREPATSPTEPVAEPPHETPEEPAEYVPDPSEDDLRHFSRF